MPEASSDLRFVKLLNRLIPLSVIAQGEYDDDSADHSEPKRPRQADRKAVGFWSDGIGGIHAVSLPTTTIGMNPSHLRERSLIRRGTIPM